MCRKRPFATRGQGRRPVPAAGCRIPCLILCLADLSYTALTRSKAARQAALARSGRVVKGDGTVAAHDGIAIQNAGVGPPHPRTPSPALWKCRPDGRKQHPPTGLGNPCGIPTFPQGHFAFLNSELRTRCEPLICVYFVSTLSPLRGTLSVLGSRYGPIDGHRVHALSRRDRPVGLATRPLERQPFITLQDGLTPHDAGLDASASRQRCLPSQPAGRVPASRRPPLAVLLDAPRPWLALPTAGADARIAD